MRQSKLLFLILLFAGSTAGAADARLHKLFNNWWQEDLVTDPIAATALGDHRYDHLLTDMSPKALELRNKRAYTRLASLRKIKREKLDATDKISYDLYERNLKLDIESAVFKPEAYAVRTFEGPQLLAELAETAPFKTAKDYDNWIARLNASGIYFDQWIALLGQAALEKRTQPRATIERILEQIKPQLVTDPEASSFYAPFKKIPDSIDGATRERLIAAGRAAVANVAVPALGRFDKFFRDVYLPASRDTHGIWDTPDGRLFYRNRIRVHTTTDLTPVQIHNMGVAEVKRIRAEMEKTLEGINFLGTLDQFIAELRINPLFYYKTPEELFAAYEKTARAIEPQLPKLFGRLPKTGFGIRPIPDASAPSTTTAYYQLPSLDGSRQGNFYVNLYRPEMRPKFEVEVLTAHESVPGHHLQTALAYELGASLPAFRRSAGYTAYVEGWALYSEGLGYDLGLYTDDFSKFGQLSYDMWRAVRLVVDTGIHSLQWTRDQAIYFFMQNAPKSEVDIVNEVDRYISWPGQALAYKIGQLKIQELRAAAEQALGDRFDIRAFHDQILSTGAVPLTLLDSETRAWIAAQSARR